MGRDYRLRNSLHAHPQLSTAGGQRVSARFLSDYRQEIPRGLPSLRQGAVQEISTDEKRQAHLLQQEELQERPWRAVWSLHQ